jgi:hypothetical protein
MEIAFEWFLGKNHLHQIIYNPCRGDCYDGLEDVDINLNQGTESKVRYPMARLTMAKYFIETDKKRKKKNAEASKINKKQFINS